MTTQLATAHQKGGRDDDVVAAGRHVEGEGESDYAAQPTEPQNNLVYKFDLGAAKLVDDEAEREYVHASGN